jgi:uncharacterized protein YjdB
MRYFKSFLRTLILGLLAIFLNRCGGGIEQPTTITVTPENPILTVGSAEPFKAIGTFPVTPDGDITNFVTWSSSDTLVATVNSNGVATALAAGTTTITGTYGDVSGSTTLTVTSATLTSIAITPADPSIISGATQQFTATGTFSDGTTHDMTGQVTWSSQNPFVATIDRNGLATAVAKGTASITATYGISSGSTTLTVNAEGQPSISVTPANPVISLGASQQFTATGTFSDGTTQDISTQATWTSSITTVAIMNNNGLATALTAGTTTITATYGGASGSTTLTVSSAALSSIAITPANPSLPGGANQQFTATGTFSDGTTRDITTQATWTSSITTVAIMNNNGLATALTAGTTTITATYGTVTGSTTLTVSTATLSSVAITPANASLPGGTTQQFTATATFSDGTTRDITTQVAWSSSNAAVAIINGNGLALAISAGAATITATYGIVTGSTFLTVSTATLSSIAITPANSSVLIGAIQQFTATGTFSDGTTHDISTQVAWSSSNTAVATVNSYGLAQALTAGATTITATFGTVSGSTNLIII